MATTHITTLKEGDIVPLLYNESKVDAEVYKIKTDKILLRHEKWEWIPINSKRLYPTPDMIKYTDSNDDSDEDDLYFTLNTNNNDYDSSSDNYNGDNNNKNDQKSDKYDKKKQKIDAIYQFANDDNYDNNNNNNNNKNNNYYYDDHVTTEEVFSCIKILKKIKRNPYILNTPLFKPIYSYLNELSNININNLNQPYSKLQKKLNKKDNITLLRQQDNILQNKSGIRIARQQRFNQSEKFRLLLENDNNNNNNDNDKQIDYNSQPIITEIDDDDDNKNNKANDDDDDDNKDDNDDDDDMDRELIEVHGQTLITCKSCELNEVISFISSNKIASKTTPFVRGTIIRDSDGKQRLDLCKQQLGPKNTKLITNAMINNHNISALLLGANGIGDIGAKSVANLIKKQDLDNNKNLSTIFLGCNLIKIDGIRALSESLHNNTTVRSLWLKRNPIGIDGSKYLAQMLSLNNYLRTLDLVSTGIEEEGTKNIINNGLLLNKKSNLRRIFLGALNIRSSLFISKYLSKMFIQCNKLKEIFLSTNDIGNDGAIELSKILLLSPHIEILSLQSCNIGDDGAISLAWIVISHPNLIYLDFGYAVNSIPLNCKSNSITDRGALVFAQVISIISHNNINTKFERLSLASNNITNIGANSLLIVLKKSLTQNNNHQIKLLSLANNNITNNQIVSSINDICKENSNWKIQPQQLINDQTDNKINNQVDNKTDNKIDDDIKTDDDIGVSDDMREQRIINQKIYTNLGEINLNDNVKGNTLSGSGYDALSIRSVYRNPKEKQFCPRIVKDGDNSNKVLNKLSLKEIYQCHGTGINQLLKKNINDDDIKTDNINNNNNNNNNDKDDALQSLQSLQSLPTNPYDNSSNNNDNNNDDNKDNDIIYIKKKKKNRRKNKYDDNINNNISYNANATQMFGSSLQRVLEPAPKLDPDQKLPRKQAINSKKKRRNSNNNNNNNNLRNFSRKCYVCKKSYISQHFFYDSLCLDCGDFNFYQRFNSSSCANMIGIVTGGRIKIGYEIVLKLLRSGCYVITTTRFPRYAAIKYSNEIDYKIWKNRLNIFGLDFCKLNQVSLFIKYISNNYNHIDFLINNAATTVRRTPQFYADIINIEKKLLPPHIPKKWVIQYQHFTHTNQVAPILNNNNNNNNKAIEYNSSISSNSTSIINKVLGNLGDYDEHSQPIDLRTNNSWTALVGSIHPIEIMETIMVNQFVPFLLINELLPLLSNKKKLKEFKNKYYNNYNNNNNNNYKNNNFQIESTWNEINNKYRLKNVRRSYIINVSAMEGRFHFFKQGTHPHTNMAKAALNMLTRTSSLRLAQEHNIFMVSVDTGWITDELPLKRRIKSKIYEKKLQQNDNTNDNTNGNNTNNSTNGTNDNNNINEKDYIFHPPLDEIDAAARCLHPIWNGLCDKPYCGVFLKDYRRIDW